MTVRKAGRSARQMDDWAAYYPGIPLATCGHCGRRTLVSRAIGICADCIRSDWPAVEERVRSDHAKTRREFTLPPYPPNAENGVLCSMCVNRCRIPPGGLGYCGTKANKNGKLVHRFGVREAILDWYYDPIPTNCVAAWVCGAHEFGCNNLAVFFRACSFNCLYCQNWHFKSRSGRVKTYTVDELAACADNRTACICYFGGDPAPQAVYSMRVAEQALARNRVSPLRICWETNGSEHPRIMKKMAAIALKSGGTIKVDLKAHDRHLHQALTGSSNEWTLENIRLLAELARQRPEPPLLVVSTLLVPGYVGAHEVGRIAAFLAALSPQTPYSLLAFYPQFVMRDLPRTSRRHADACLAAAEKEGLTRVRLANIHLLW